MEMIATCLENLSRAIGGMPNGSFLQELTKEQMAGLFAEVADRPCPVGSGWGNVHATKVLLFNLENLKDDVRRAFLIRLADQLAGLGRPLPPPAAAAVGAALPERVAPDGTPVAGQADCGTAAEDRPSLVPSAHQRRPDWFDRLLDWAEWIARGLGFAALIRPS